MKEMKKFLLMLFVVALPMGFVACSDDDDDPEQLAANIEGTYKGTASVTELAEAGIPAMETTVKITKTGTTEVTINLGTITVGDTPIPLGDITAVKLSGTEGNVVIDKQKKSLTIMTFPLNTEISGTVKESKTLKITSTVDISALSSTGQFPMLEDLKELSVVVDATK